MHRSTLEEGAQLLVGSPSLRDRWFGHHSKEDCCGDNILACPSKEWQVVIVIIIANAPVDVTSPASGYAAIATTPELLLERRV